MKTLQDATATRLQADDTAAKCNRRTVVWHDSVDAQTVIDARVLAAQYGLGPLSARGYRWFSPSTFDEFGATNHRAQIGATLDEMYPDHDSKCEYRAYSHHDSVEWHTRNASAPVIVWCDQLDERRCVLDGAHRIAAAYLTHSHIRALIVGPEVVTATVVEMTDVGATATRKRKRSELRSSERIKQRKLR